MGGAARTMTAAVGALALGVVGAWLFRAPIAEAAIRAALRDAGFANPTLKVAALDFGRIEVKALKAGANGDVSINRLDARFALGEALSGKLRTVSIGRGRVVENLVGDSGGVWLRLRVLNETRSGDHNETDYSGEPTV